jgi:hypothetical protein
MWFWMFWCRNLVVLLVQCYRCEKHQARGDVDSALSVTIEWLHTDGSMMWPDSSSGREAFVLDGVLLLDSVTRSPWFEARSSGVGHVRTVPCDAARLQPVS